MRNYIKSKNGLAIFTFYRGFHLGTDKVKTEDKKYGFDGLQVVKDNLQTAIKVITVNMARAAATVCHRVRSIAQTHLVPMYPLHIAEPQSDH
jgi:hypothetical protein